MTLRLDGDLDGALQHRKKALEILEPLVPPGHSRIVVHQTDYAYDLLAAGQFEQARRNFEAGLAQCDRNQALRAFRPMFRGGLAGALWELGQRPAAPWDNFRSDCSGFVSWAWQIMDDPTTATYVSDRAGPNGWTTIPIDSLRAGDALVTDGHMKLFSHFVGSNGVDILEEFSAATSPTRKSRRSPGAATRCAWAATRGVSRDPAQRRDGTAAARGRDRVPVQHAPAVDGRHRARPQLGARHEARDQPQHHRARRRRLPARVPGQHRPALDRWHRRQPQLAARHEGRDQPSITALAGGGFQVAFQANTGQLRTVGTARRQCYPWGVVDDDLAARLDQVPPG
jgi:hypothetical protein